MVVILLRCGAASGRSHRVLISDATNTSVNNNEHFRCWLSHLNIAEVPLAKQLSLYKRLLHCRRCCRQLCVRHDGRSNHLSLLTTRLLFLFSDVRADGQPPGGLFCKIPLSIQGFETRELCLTSSTWQQLQTVLASSARSRREVTEDISDK